jgi:hypothetical protein
MKTQNFIRLTGTLVLTLIVGLVIATPAQGHRAAINIDSKMLTAELEKPLQIETWMVNDYFWDVKINATVEEPQLRIENWMINDSLWANPRPKNANRSIEGQQPEEKIALEPWMTDQQLWKIEKQMPQNTVL